MPLLPLGDALRLPWPAQVNPLEGQLEKEGIADLVDACRDAGMGSAATLCREMSRAASRVLPHASWPLLLACHAWLVWFVLFDDAIEASSESEGEAGKPRHIQLFDLFAKGTVPRGVEAFTWLGLEVRRRILPALTPAASEHFFQAVEDYMLRGVRPATLWREANQEPDLIAYEAVRVYDVGLLPVVALMEAGLGIEISPEARASAEAQRAFHAAARIVAWVNDIVSLDREIQRGEIFNIMLVLMRSGMTPMKARGLVEAHILADVETLEDLRQSANRSPDAPPQAYFDALVTLVRGCVDAHEGLERYADDVPTSIAARRLMERPTVFKRGER